MRKTKYDGLSWKIYDRLCSVGERKRVEVKDKKIKEDEGVGMAQVVFLIEKSFKCSRWMQSRRARKRENCLFSVRRRRNPLLRFIIHAALNSSLAVLSIALKGFSRKIT